jgi:hypothetical protein
MTYSPLRRFASSPFSGAASPLGGGTLPVARRSRFHGSPGSSHFAPDAALAGSVLSPCGQRSGFSGLLRVSAFARRQSLIGAPPGRLM